MALRRSRRRGPGAATRLWTSIELALGVALLAGAAFAGLLFAKRGGENRVDAAGYLHLPADPHSLLANDLVRLGSKPVLVVGVIVVFLVAVFRDWVRAFACAAAPLIAVEVVEHVAKPMVGREIGAGSFTYPSGTVAAISALATAVFLVAPRLTRPAVALAGAIAIVGTGIAVLVLRWHYPTDVIGGVWVGSGAVFFIDALAHVPWLFTARQRWVDPPSSPRAPSSAIPV